MADGKDQVLQSEYFLFIYALRPLDQPLTHTITPSN